LIHKVTVRGDKKYNYKKTKTMPIEIQVKEPTLKVEDGKIFVEGVETYDAELIGFAFLDFSQELKDRRLDMNTDFQNIIF